MYQFSRAIYRELAPRLAQRGGAAACESKQHMLAACESTMNRLAVDRRYFARPTKALFTDLRNLFPIQDQLHVYRVVDRHVRLALRYLDSVPAEELAVAAERECRAHTRRGTPCQREPLPGRDYCPSHKHLEEDVAAELAADEQAEVALAA